MINCKLTNILILNGPNLNLLGNREPSRYGKIKLNNIINDLVSFTSKFNIKIKHFQSNSEHDLINYIHNCNNDIDFIIINPAAFTHTSIALRDALLAININFIEVHISNIYSREKFRHYSYFSDIAFGVICGFGTNVYYLAIQAIIKYLSLENKI